MGLDASASLGHSIDHVVEGGFEIGLEVERVQQQLFAIPFEIRELGQAVGEQIEAVSGLE
jgi:hypothetical protein